MANFSIFDKDEMIIGENGTPKYLQEQGRLIATLIMLLNIREEPEIK